MTDLQKIAQRILSGEIVQAVVCFHDPEAVTWNATFNTVDTIAAMGYMQVVQVMLASTVIGNADGMTLNSERLKN